MITLGQVRQLVIRALIDNQEDGARPIPDPNSIPDTLCPIGGLEGFDSYSAMETTLELSELLGCEIDESVFVNKATRSPATLGEIVDAVFRIVNAKELSTHGD